MARVRAVETRHAHLRKVVAKKPLPGFSTLWTSERDSSSLLQQCSAAPAWTPSRDSVFSGSLLTSHLVRKRCVLVLASMLPVAAAADAS